VLGDDIGFAMGHFGGRRLVKHYGGTSSSLRSGSTAPQRSSERHGGKIIIAARFIEGLR